MACEEFRTLTITEKLIGMIMGYNMIAFTKVLGHHYWCDKIRAVLKADDMVKDGYSNLGNVDDLLSITLHKGIIDARVWEMFSSPGVVMLSKILTAATSLKVVGAQLTNKTHIYNCEKLNSYEYLQIIGQVSRVPPGSNSYDWLIAYS